MGSAVVIRSDFSASALRRFARNSRDADQTRRLLALAVILEGGSRSDAAKVGGVTLQIVRDWVLKFNAHGPDGLMTGKSPGAPSKLTPEQTQALINMVEMGPHPDVHGVVRWRLKDLCHWVWEEYRVSLAEYSMSRILKRAGYRHLSARPQHPKQDEHVLEAFKKTSPHG